MHYLEQVATPTKKGLVQNALEIAQKYEIGDLLRVDKEGDRAQDARSAIREIRARQRQGLGEERTGKAIHGIFQAEVEKRGCDRTATYAWMRRGRFRAETEGLIIAAQDGIIHIAAYRHGVIKDGRDPMCRECGTMMETMGHILVACLDYNWNLYKKRHDAVLDILVGAVAERLRVAIPRNRWMRNGTAMSAMYEGERATILVDQCIPTKGHFAARRPDLMVRIYSTKTIIILKVACAWNPNVAEREAQKKSKHRELAADLAHQWPQYQVTNFPVAIGTMGLIVGLRKALLGTGLWDEAEVRELARTLQTSVLNGAVRIIRRHLKVHQEVKGQHRTHHRN